MADEPDEVGLMSPPPSPFGRADAWNAPNPALWQASGSSPEYGLPARFIDTAMARQGNPFAFPPDPATRIPFDKLPWLNEWVVETPPVIINWPATREHDVVAVRRRRRLVPIAVAIGAPLAVVIVGGLATDHSASSRGSTLPNTTTTAPVRATVTISAANAATTTLPTTAPTTAVATTTTIKPIPAIAAPEGGMSSQEALARPFADTSPWNSRVAAGTVFAPTAVFQNQGRNRWINLEQYSTPVFFATADNPVVNVQVFQAWGEHGRPAGGYAVPMPPDAHPAEGSDRSMIVVDVTTQTVYEFWRMEKIDDGWRAAAGGVEPLTGTGFGHIEDGTLMNAGVQPIGSSSLGGLITGENLRRGVIDHALAVALPFNELKAGFVAPAIAEDLGAAQEFSGTLPEGTRLAIPRGTARPGALSPAGKMVFDALTEYGAYVVGSTGTNTLGGFMAEPNTVSAEQINPLRVSPSGSASDLAKMTPLLQIVAG